MNETVLPVFKRCVEAIREGALIKRESNKDKEYHFQNWFNADHNYKHKNRSVKGFGSYGDISIRDRKMYVVPTPFQVAEGLAHHRTLILPSTINADANFFEVGVLVRSEASELIIGYSFDLQTNEISAKTKSNPGADTKHMFRAWRLKGSPKTPTKMRDTQVIKNEVATSTDETDE